MKIAEQVLQAFEAALQAPPAPWRGREAGTLRAVGHGVALVEGLPNVGSEELVRFCGGLYGLAFNLDPGEVGVILLDDEQHLAAGCDVERTGRVLDVPVGRGLLGRVVDPLGRPCDDGGPILFSGRLPVERPAPSIIHRAPVNVPLETGLKVVDSLLPIGRGQRMLIMGDRQTGKTSIALDAVIHQRHFGVLCVLCFVGQRSSAVAAAIEQLRLHGAMAYTLVVVARGEDPPGLQYLAPYAATAMAEHFVEHGQDVLIVYDDLTRHARAYRELSLLLRRPPGREAFPGDIFYAHSRLLERSIHLSPALGGGSLTALPVVETEAQNLAAYIPTNLISITDGQILLSPVLFQKGQLPAVEVGTSVSRVGGDAQLPAYRAVAGDLRLAYAQFEELESFSRLASRLDEATSRTLERGRRVRQVLRQDELHPQMAPHQIAILLAATAGWLDSLPVDKVAWLEGQLQTRLDLELPDWTPRIRGGLAPENDGLQRLVQGIIAGVAQP